MRKKSWIRKRTEGLLRRRRTDMAKRHKLVMKARERKIERMKQKQEIDKLRLESAKIGAARRKASPPLFSGIGDIGGNLGDFTKPTYLGKRISKRKRRRY